MKALKTNKSTSQFNKFQKASLSIQSQKQVKGGTGNTTSPIKYDEHGFIIVEDQLDG